MGIKWFSGGTERGLHVTNRISMEDNRKFKNITQPREGQINFVATQLKSFNPPLPQVITVFPVEAKKKNCFYSMWLAQLIFRSSWLHYILAALNSVFFQTRWRIRYISLRYTVSLSVFYPCCWLIYIQMIADKCCIHEIFCFLSYQRNIITELKLLVNCNT